LLSVYPVSFNRFNIKSSYPGKDVSFSAMKNVRALCSDGKLHRTDSWIVRDFVHGFPRLVEQHFPKGAEVHCFGCASGAEPYTFALSFLQDLVKGAKNFLPIKASDISPDMIATAKSGTLIIDGREIYEYGHKFKKIPFDKVFTAAGMSSGQNVYNVSPGLMKWVNFSLGNILVEAKKPFEKPAIILCRNMWHHFKPNQTVQINILANALYKNLQKGGMVIIGELEYTHTDLKIPETLQKVGFKELQRYVFYKPAPAM